MHQDRSQSGPRFLVLSETMSGPCTIWTVGLTYRASPHYQTVTGSPDLPALSLSKHEIFNHTLPCLSYLRNCNGNDVIFVNYIKMF